MNYWERKRANENWNEEKGPRFLFLFLNSFEVECRWGQKRAGFTWKLSFASPQTVNDGSDSDASQTMSIRLGLFTLDPLQSILSRCWRSIARSTRSIAVPSVSCLLAVDLEHFILTIASTSRPDSHPYLLSRSRERAGADYDKEDGGRENKTGWSGLRPQIHQM